MKYRIIKEKEPEKDYSGEIRTLCNLLNIEGYLKRPHIYEKHRELLLTLNTFLTKDREKLRTSISKNERAYQIWNDEKILDSSLCQNLIEWNNLNEMLNYYLTPEPFFDYIHTKKDKMTILIIENKDTWYTMRKLMDAEKGDYFLYGEEIDGLLYGEGNKITKTNALEEYQKEVIQRKCKFLYWGDLDYTGIEMCERVIMQNKDVCIEPFIKIYEKMMEEKEIEELGQIKHKQNQNIDLEFFLNYFDTKYKEEINLILSQNKYIPQEIINPININK